MKEKTCWQRMVTKEDTKQTITLFFLNTYFKDLKQIGYFTII